MYLLLKRSEALLVVFEISFFHSVYETVSPSQQHWCLRILILLENHCLDYKNKVNWRNDRDFILFCCFTVQG